MKKITAILLLCIYSFAIMGFSLKELYCCGKLTSVSFTLVAKEKNRGVDSNTNNDCCKTKFRFFKVNDGHFSPGLSISALTHFVQIPGLTYSHNRNPFFTLRSE